MRGKTNVPRLQSGTRVQIELVIEHVRLTYLGGVRW